MPIYRADKRCTTYPMSISSCSEGRSSGSHWSRSPIGGGGGKDSIQVRDGVLTALPMGFCLGLPNKHRKRPAINTTRQQKTLSEQSFGEFYHCSGPVVRTALQRVRAE